jgi:hypothetical protein
MANKNQGIRSNKLTHPGVRTGQARRGQNPKWTSQVGSAMGDHVTERRYQIPRNKVAEPRHDGKTGISVRMGNEVAAATKCGPGGSRNVSATGSQGVHGAPAAGNPRPVGPDIFTEFPGKGR